MWLYIIIDIIKKQNDTKEVETTMRIRKLIGNIRDTLKSAIDSVKTIKEQPLKSLGELFPIAMVFVSIIGFIAAFSSFISNNGYSKQIQIIKNDFIDGIGDAFTTGTVHILTTGMVSTIILLLLLAEFIVMLISFYQTENKIKKIASVVCLGLGVVVFGVAGFILAVGYDIINFSYEIESKILSIFTIFDGADVSTVLQGFEIAAFIGAAALFIFIILMLTSQYLWMVKKSAIALLVSYVLLPLLLLMFENIVPMITGAIAVVLLGIFAVIGLKAAVSGTESEDGGVSGCSKDYNYSNNRSIDTEPIENKPKEIKPKTKNYNFNTYFWRDKGGLGVAQAAADCIYVKDSLGVTQYVCTVEEYEKGKVIINMNRVRVTNVAGCKYPER